MLPAYGFAVASREVTVDTLLATLPFATVVFLNLLDTTWPDRRADAAVGKATLATRWPARRLRAVYVLGAAATLGSFGLLAGAVLPPTRGRLEPRRRAAARVGGRPVHPDPVTVPHRRGDGAARQRPARRLGRRCLPVVPELG